MAEPSRRPHVAVIGAGWSGCAAAVTLARAGVAVTLLEQGRTLGGRARRVLLDGTPVDNGQHLLAGAYRQTLALIEQVQGAGRSAALFHRLPLTLRPFGHGRGTCVSLAANRLPAPLHLAGTLVTARGLSWRDRRALLACFRDLARRDFVCAPDRTVAELFADAPRTIVNELWAPLCLAALNTPPERASARVFARVLREAFTGPSRNSDFLVPAVDLSACFPDAAAKYVVDRAGCVRTGVAVRSVEGHAGGVAVRMGHTKEDYAAAIVAVGPHQLRQALGPVASTQDDWRKVLARTDSLGYEPITTVYLRFAAPLPMRAPLLRLDDRPGQWIFRHAGAARASAADHRDPVYAVVISAGPRDALGHSALATAVADQLRRLASGLPAVRWARVISERRATYACVPAIEQPNAGRIVPHVYLAGDYTDPDLPATLEAATRSGVTAAETLLADLGSARSVEGR